MVFDIVLTIGILRKNNNYNIPIVSKCKEVTDFTCNKTSKQFKL